MMSGFAAVWFAWGLSATPINRAWYTVPAAVSAMLIAVSLRMRMAEKPAARRHARRILLGASGAEWLAMGLTYPVLIQLGHPEFAECAIAGIVGLHFLPLAYFLPVRSYYVTACAIIGLALAGCAMPNDAGRLLIVGAGTAILLWLTSLGSLARARQPAL